MKLKAALANTQVAFCDSKQALQQAYSHGLPEKALIKTISPTLILSGVPNIESLEDKLSESAYCNFFYSGKDFAESIYRAALLNDDLHQYALLIARVVSRNDYFCLKAGLLDDNDFSQPRTVIDFDTGNSAMNMRMGSVWAEMLQPNKNLTKVVFNVSVDDELDISGGQPPSFFERLRFASYHSLQYRALERLGQLLPKSCFKGHISILSEGETVKEVATTLGRRGYQLSKLDLKLDRVSKTIVSNEKVHAINSTIKPLVEARAATISPLMALKPIVDRCISQTCEAIESFDDAISYWNESLADEKPVAVLTGYPDGPEVLALSAVAKKRTIPFFSFQHGLDREVTQMQDHNHVNFENSVAEFFITYNSFARQLSQNNIYANNRSSSCESIFPGGWSSEHLSVAKKRVRLSHNGATVLFVSTAVYRGYFAMRTDAVTDVNTARQELSLLNQVFDLIPHKVAYKPYPAMRFSDPNLALEHARKSNNILVVGTHIDLRYLIQDYRVLVVSRASSTMGWCLLSRKPLIYIDMPYWFGLREELRDLFKDSFFYFDANKVGFMEELKKFLSRPLQEIEQSWAEKEPSRRLFMKKFINDVGPIDGAKVAEFIEGKIKAFKK